MMNIVHKIVIILLLILYLGNLQAQGLEKLILSDSAKLTITGVQSNTGKIFPVHTMPIVTYLLNGSLKSTAFGKVNQQADSLMFTDGDLQITFKDQPFEKGARMRIIFKNNSISDTFSIGNVVPFGEDSTHIYITGKGENELSRSHLFRPGYEPVNVILPDNAWETGFSAVSIDGEKGICALARRAGWEKRESTAQAIRNVAFPGRKRNIHALG